MTAIQCYKIDIIKRTREILEDFYPKFEENDREATFLMNCLLGIIIAITETERKERILLRGNIDDEFIKFVPEKVGFISSNLLNDNYTNHDLNEIKLHIGHKKDLIGRDKFWLISKIRNCIAHQNIYGINTDGKWVGVKLWNIYNSQRDFEIVFSIEELKSFTIDLANKFLGKRDIN